MSEKEWLLSEFKKASGWELVTAGAGKKIASMSFGDRCTVYSALKNPIAVIVTGKAQSRMCFGGEFMNHLNMALEKLERIKKSPNRFKSYTYNNCDAYVLFKPTWRTHRWQQYIYYLPDVNTVVLGGCYMNYIDQVASKTFKFV